MGTTNCKDRVPFCGQERGSRVDNGRRLGARAASLSQPFEPKAFHIACLDARDTRHEEGRRIWGERRCPSSN